MREKFTWEKAIFDKLSKAFENTITGNDNEKAVADEILLALGTRLTIYELKSLEEKDINAEKLQSEESKYVTHCCLVTQSIKKDMKVKFVDDLTQIYNSCDKEKPGSFILSSLSECIKLTTLTMLQEAIKQCSKEKVTAILKTVKHPHILLNTCHTFLGQTPLHAAMQQFGSELGEEKICERRLNDLYGIIGLLVQKGSKLSSKNKNNENCYKHLINHLPCEQSKMTKNMLYQLTTVIEDYDFKQSLPLIIALQNEGYPMYQDQDIKSVMKKSFLENATADKPGKSNGNPFFFRALATKRTSQTSRLSNEATELHSNQIMR